MQGNHEDFGIRHVRSGDVDVAQWTKYGGGWFVNLPRERQRQFADAFALLPLVIEVPTPSGFVGIVHADIPPQNWSDLEQALMLKQHRDHCQWSRRRIDQSISTLVQGVRAVIVGHSPIDRPNPCESRWARRP